MGPDSHGTLNSGEYTVHRTILCVVRAGDVRGHFSFGRERVDGSEGAGELEGAERVECAV